MSFEFAPKGWTLCNGQLLPINQNQALFSLLDMDVSAPSRSISRGNRTRTTIDTRRLEKRGRESTSKKPRR